MFALKKPILNAAMVASVMLLIACGDGQGTPNSQATQPEDTETGTATVIQDGPLKGYYFEASVKTSSQAAQKTDYLVIKGWYSAPNRTRWELSSSSGEDYRRILLIDGDEQWFYEPGTNTYTHGKEKTDSGKPYPLPSTYQLGIVTPSGAQPVRTEKYLGRDVDVYETSTAQVKTVNYVDHELGVTLRQVVTSTDPNLSSYEAKVEKIQYNPRLDRQVFVFTPPSGSREGTTGATAGTITPSRGPLNVPPGMLSPSYIPEGYKLDSSSSSATGGVTSYIERKLSSPNGGYLTLTEQYRPGGLPDYLKTGTPLKVGKADGYSTRGGGQVSLLVYDRDVIINMTANNLTLDDLKKIAESMD